MLLLTPLIMEKIAMKKSRFTEEWAIYALCQAEGGTDVDDVFCNLGISQATFYIWKKKYGGLDASELKHVKELEQQLSEYKAMAA